MGFPVYKGKYVSILTLQGESYLPKKQYAGSMIHAKRNENGINGKCGKQLKRKTVRFTLNYTWRISISEYFWCLYCVSTNVSKEE